MLRITASVINRVLLAPFGLRLVRTKWDAPDPHPTLPGGPFSAFGEEAILRGLIARIPDIGKTYADIGAGDGITWSNTCRLAIDGWRGIAFEYNLAKVHAMAAAYATLDNVRVCHARITPKNVCVFLDAYELPQHFGVLSLDIDSYDYFVLQAILTRFRPAIIVAEINEKFPPPIDFTRLDGDAPVPLPGLCYGQSISRIASLCLPLDYAIAQLEYNNVFLVDRRRLALPGLSPPQAYDQGYRQRPDRLQKFPYNRNLEPVLTLPPAQALESLRQHLEPCAGNYTMEISAA